MQQYARYGNIKYGNELSNSIKCGELRERLSNYKFLKCTLLHGVLLYSFRKMTRDLQNLF